MTHRGPFQPLPFCVILWFCVQSRVLCFVLFSPQYQHYKRGAKRLFCPLKVSSLAGILSINKTTSVLSTLKSVILQYHNSRRGCLFSSFPSSAICHLRWNSSCSIYSGKLAPQFYVCRDKMCWYGFKGILIMWPDALDK